jgi:hypothetical protein
MKFNIHIHIRKQVLVFACLSEYKVVVFILSFQDFLKIK